tara:strand:- start:1123 stop:1425 length:303 start_codon:yes stop_codon:yes gene_type:complete
MSSILEALRNRPRKQPKKHFVKVGGKEIEVSLEKKLEIIRRGEDRYMLEENQIVLKPERKIKAKFKKLVDSEKGYYFLDNDIHWPEKIGEGGKTWQIEYE